ncbi:hypothetical protein WDU94_005965 [Cyamophila willieti]
MESPKRSGSKTGSSGDDGGSLGQEKIVRAFSEIMKNMGRMKTCVRPSMCKPYGKQSESLQKSKYCATRMERASERVIF